MGSLYWQSVVRTVSDALRKEFDECAGTLEEAYPCTKGHVIQVVEQVIPDNQGALDLI